jgi:hypothetical protein
MNPSLGSSARLLLKKTLHHWGLFVSGATASAISWALYAGGVQKVPWYVFGIAGVGLLVGAIVRAFHDVRLERDAYERQLSPVFEFSDRSPACSQIGQNQDLGLHELRRLVVSNSGGSSVSGVRVSLVNIRPDGQATHFLTAKMPLPLLPQHFVNAPPNYAFTLAPGEERPIDVFATTSEFPLDLVLFHAVRWTDSHIEKRAPGETYLLDIQVIGNNVPSVTRVVAIGVDDQGHPFLRLV